MGLRMFVEPDANGAKAAIKTDPSATARSAIRRQRTVRYTPQSRDRPSSRAHPDAVSREINQRRLLRVLIRQRDRERGHVLRQDHERERLILESEREAERADVERAAISRQQRLVSGRAILRDALSYERPSQRMRILRDYDDMPDLIPITETERSSYSEVLQRPADSEARGQTQVAADSRLRSPPPRYMPTPPYSFEDSSSRSTPTRLTPPSNPADYTPRFALASRLANESMDEYMARVGHINSNQLMFDEVLRTRQEVERTREEVRRTREEVNRTWRDSDLSYDSLDELPPLRRISRRHRGLRPLSNSQPPRSQSNIDGLGDRRRSFSPEDNAWDTLLTTITPDERVPSVHSSFTSATASASASVPPNPTSSNSYGTLATFPSSMLRAGLYPNLCDNSDSEDLLTEDESATTTMQESADGSTSRTIANANPSRRRPVYSRRYENGSSDRAGQLASLGGLGDEDVDVDPRLDLRTFIASESNHDVELTYEDRHRRNRLRHLRATEMGTERSSGVRPARERL